MPPPSAPLPPVAYATSTASWLIPSGLSRIRYLGLDFALAAASGLRGGDGLLCGGQPFAVRRVRRSNLRRHRPHHGFLLDHLRLHDHQLVRHASLPLACRACLRSHHRESSPPGWAAELVRTDVVIPPISSRAAGSGKAGRKLNRAGTVSAGKINPTDGCIACGRWRPSSCVGGLHRRFTHERFEPIVGKSSILPRILVDRVAARAHVRDPPRRRDLIRISPRVPGSFASPIPLDGRPQYHLLHRAFELPRLLLHPPPHGEADTIGRSFRQGWRMSRGWGNLCRILRLTRSFLGAS